MKPIRVLTVGMTATAGGVENFLMSYLGRIDQTRVRFDFLTRYEDAAYPDKRREIGQTYVIPRRSEDPARYYREIRAFFEQHAGDYDVLWDNECMFSDLTPLKLAAQHGIPVRIAHSHMPQNMDPSLAGKGRGALHRVQRRGLDRYANMLWACSEESARWACPDMNLPVTIIPNAIDAQAYRFDPAVRARVRAHYGWEDCLVVGDVGRLQYQKNQAFLLDAFARLHEREPRARLVLVGEGPNLLSLEARAVSLGVENEVLFLGHRDDVPRLLQAFDLFVMPSRFEGLGMAAVEAQAAGLPCLLSDAFPRAAAITADVAFLAPEDPDRWAERMLDMLQERGLSVRPDNTAAIARAGYDLAEAAEQLTARFEQIVRERSGFKRRYLLVQEGTVPSDALAEKARRDVQQIAAEAGYAMRCLPAIKPADRWWQRIPPLGKLLLAWCRMFFQLRHGDLLLVQYPLYPQRDARLTRAALHMLQWKGAKTAAFVHDLDSLCHVRDAAARWSDQELLLSFDHLIVQNARMADYLLGQGARADALINGQLRDYVTDAPLPERSLEMSVCVAGDLSRKRSRYLHELPRTRLQWHLYGTGWKGKAGRGDITWHGEEMTALSGAFGLVWDGASPRVISGAQGAYMMLTSPLAMSRYLANGLPVIVWKWSAMAAFVRENGLGLVVDAIDAIPAAIGALNPQEYAAMAASARQWGEKLRRGELTRAALKRLG